MRAGADTLLGRVMKVFGSTRVYHGYLSVNSRGTRAKLVAHDGFRSMVRHAVLD